MAARLENRAGTGSAWRLEIGSARGADRRGSAWTGTTRAARLATGGRRGSATQKRAARLTRGCTRARVGFRNTARVGSGRGAGLRSGLIFAQSDADFRTRVARRVAVVRLKCGFARRLRTGAARRRNEATRFGFGWPPRFGLQTRWASASACDSRLKAASILGVRRLRSLARGGSTWTDLRRCWETGVVTYGG